MSRLSRLSPAALKAMFSVDSDDTLLCLLTISGNGIPAPARLVDGYTHKFEWASATAMSVTHIETQAVSTYAYKAGDAIIRDTIAADPTNAFYGVMSGGVPFLFLPFALTLPSEEQEAAPRCSLSIHDVTRLLIPVIRTINSAPSVSLSLVLTASPDTVEASFPDFLLGGISYDADAISGELTVESFAAEPFPCHGFTPSYFPGLF